MSPIIKRKASPKRLRQPIHQPDGWCFILRPGAFFWTAGRLYVGYAQLSCLHQGEEPMWDCRPVKPGTIIETRGGFYQFTGIQQEGKPYWRQYATLQFAYLYRPDDTGNGFLRKKIDQGSIEIHEKYTLAPETYLEAQWLSDALLHKSYRSGRKLEPKILRQTPIDAMRRVGRKLRDDMEDLFSNVADRKRMIEKFAVFD